MAVMSRSIGGFTARHAAAAIGSETGIKTGAILRAIGDSLTGDGATGAVSSQSTYANQAGEFTWFQFLTGNAVYHDIFCDGDAAIRGCNLGVGGDKTQDALNRIEDLLQLQSDVVHVMLGTNDITGSLSAEEIFLNLKTISEMIIRNGSKVLLSTVPPRNNDHSGGFTSDQQTVRIALNTKIRSYAASMDGSVILVDRAAYLEDANKLLPSSFSLDGIHPNSTWAYKVASDLLIPLWQKTSGISRAPRAIPAAYSASNIYGDLLTNGVFSGTGGTLGTGTSGTMPDSWRSDRTTGTTATAVMSLVTQPDWNNSSSTWVRAEISTDGAASGDEDIRIRPTASAITSNLVTGGWYKGEIEINVSAISGENNLRTVYLEVRDQTGTNTYMRCFATGNTYTSINDYMPVNSFRGVLQTPPLRLDGTTGVTFYVYTTVDAGTTGTRIIELCKPVLRRIVDPRPLLYGRSRKTILRDVSNDTTFLVPMGYRIAAITVNEKTGNAITGGLKFGTTSGGVDVVAALTVSGSSYVTVSDSALLKRVFSPAAYQTIYVQDVSAWNNAVVDITVDLELCS